MTFENVTLIAHADWSKSPAKRWMAVAVLQSSHRWLVGEVSQVQDPSNFFTKLKSRLIIPGCVLTGFDFPIGLPYRYAARVGITDFLSALPLFGHADWDQFYSPAESSADISLYRPFYPARPGNSRRIHLEQGLGLSFEYLYRLCEVARENRRAACPLFWTMGGQQVGKAAQSGWSSLIAPALIDPGLNLKIWPFSGSLAQVCPPGNIVVVETYPAEFYQHLGLSFSSGTRKSKRRQADRHSFAERLIAWSAVQSVGLEASVIRLIEDGFGHGPDGEDQFDALVGLYGMINVILGNHPAGEPNLPHLQKIEGWIFGQEQCKQ